GRGGVRAAVLSAVPLVAGGAIVASVLGMVLHALWAVPYAIAVLPFMAMATIASGYSYGLGNVRLPNAINLWSTIMTIAFIGSGLLLESRDASVAIVMWLAANVVLGVACMAGVLVHARKLKQDSVSTRKFLHYTLRLSGMYVARVLNYRIDMYVVAFLTSVTALGLYGVAVSGAEALLTFTEVAAVVTIPRIGALPRQEAAAFTARCLRYNLLLASIAAAALAIVAPFAVVLVYGRAFAPAISSLQVLCIGVVALSMIGVITNYYTLNTGRPMVALLMQLGSMAICVALSFLLVPVVGIVGAAIATSVSYVVSVTAILVWFSRQEKIALSAILLPQRDDIVYLWERTIPRARRSATSA
ncbi:MAG: polysaccharide biosynthesis C-terminal domain-containing protein, partial [Polyangiaceae bacterium]